MKACPTYRALLFIWLLTFLPFAYAADTITSIAGDGTAGYAGDGLTAVKDARLNAPADLTLDSAGNVYIADTANQVIRQIDAKGIITTLAGKGQSAGYTGDGNAATEAQLNQPVSVVLDSQGNFYLSDMTNHVIRKIDTTGKISTLAGQGTKSGYSGDGKVATEAQLNAPRELAIDSTGNSLYIADTGNHVIRKVENLNDTDVTKHLISTIAGGGTTATIVPNTTATAAKLQAPTGITLDKTGNTLYIADSADNRILKVDAVTDADPAKRLISIVAGGGTSGLGDGGLAIAAQLNNPYDVVLDSQGNLYIADKDQQRIRKVDSTGVISTVAGNGVAGFSGDGKAATSAQVNSPQGLAIDSQDNLYLADTANHRLRKIIHTADTGGPNFSLTINHKGTGKGTVTAPVGIGNGINCGDTCTDSYSTNTAVTLLATPATGSTLTSWTGDCTGTTTTVTVTVGAAKTCTATFDLIPTPSNLTFVEAKTNNADGVAGLQGTTSVAISNDGQFVYATGYFDNAVAVFNRHATTGKLTFTQVIKDGVNNIKDLQGANAVAISPDNKNVYVTSARSNALVALNRDLTLLQFHENGVAGIDGLGGISSLAMSPDGLRVYVTGTRDNALAAFSRDANTGLLTFLQVQKNTVNGIAGLGGATSVAVTHNLAAPTNIYVASGTDNAITVFRRDPTLGELIFVGTYQNGVANITGLINVYGVTVSPDDKQVYAAIRGGIVALNRDLNTGALTFQGVYPGKATGISGFSGAPLVIKPDGSELYVTSVDDNALTIFGRDAQTGALVFKSSLVNGTGNLQTLDGAMGVAVSPDGKHVYTTALRSNAVSLFSGTAIDLAVTMTSSGDSIAISSPLSYSLTVTNQGTDAAPDVTLTDTLPTRVIFTSASSTQGTCSPTTEGKVTCLLGTLDQGKSVTIDLKVTTPATVTGTQEKLLNKATVTTSQPDNNDKNNTAQLETTLLETVPQADLGVSIATTPASDTVAINSTLIYTVTVTNNGPATVSSTVLTNTLPTGVTYNAAASDKSCTQDATKPELVVCQLGSGGSPDSVAIPLQITTPNAPTTLKFTTSVKSAEADPKPDNNQASKEINVIQAVNLDLEVVDALADPNTLGISSQKPIVYKVTVRNNSDLQATGVTLTSSSWPTKQVSYVSDTGRCTFTDHLECNIGTLDAKATKEIDIQTKPVGPGLDIPIKFTLTSAGTDTNSSNDAKTAMLNITGQVADMVVSVTDDSTKSGAAAANNPITYTITVSNAGPNVAGATLAIDLSLGSNTVVIEDTKAADGTCQAGSTSGSVQCTLNPILANGNSVVTLKATPKGTGTLTLTAIATLGGDAFDPNTNNNTVKKDIAVSDTKADLAITLTASPQPVLKNTDLAFEATVTNTGPNDATGVTVALTVPTTFTFKSAQSDNLASQCVAVPTAQANVITCPLNPLPSTSGKNSYLVRIITTPTEGGKFEHSVKVSSSVFDPSLANNTASLMKDTTPLQVEVTQFVADLVLKMTTSPAPVVGDPLTYTISVTNQGPNDANQVTITDTLPVANQVKYNSAKSTPETGSQCYDLNPQRQLVCTIEKLPLNSTTTLTVEVQPLAPGKVTNSVEVKSAEFDSNGADNQATDTTYVNNPATLFFVEAQKNGAGNVQGLQGVIALTLSPDSNYLYAAGFKDNAVVVFSRASTDGKLSFVQALFNGKEGIDGLTAPTGVSLSPDGAYLYVSSLNDSAVSVFKRDTLTGKLTFVEAQKNSVGGVTGLSGAFAVRATDKHVYAAGASDKAIALFNRDSNTGKLTFVEAKSDKNLDGVSALTLTPDGLQLLAASVNSDSLTLFNRDPNTGSLSLLQTVVNQADNIQGLDGTSGVLVSPDNKFVYAIGAGTDNAIVTFSHASTLTFVEALRNGTNSIDSLTGPAGLTISKDGNYVYVTSATDNAVVMFKRDPLTGKLSFLDVLKSSGDVLGLGGPRDIVVTPSGAQIYVAGFADNAIALLRIASSDLKVTLADSKDPVNVAESFSYTLTVTNSGPNPATNVVVEDQLPANLSLLQLPANSLCSHTEEHKVVCKLDRLDVNGSFKAILPVSANDTGDFTNQVVVTADQVDPSPNTATETTKVMANADLEISMIADPTILSIGSNLTYHLTVTNHGPDTVKDVKVTAVLPDKLRYISAAIASVANSCAFASVTGEVTCLIPSLKAKMNALVTIMTVPTVAGNYTTKATVTSTAFDPKLPNNNAEQTVKVNPNVIANTYDNQGKELRDYLIDTTGQVVGGSLGGTIDHQGLITDVHILPNTTVKGEKGGKLSGTITNDGIINNTQLLSNTVINGGLLQGDIAGFPNAPATLNARIEAGTHLSNVLIAVGSVVDPKAILGEGVRFLANTTIPPGINLMTALPAIVEPISQRHTVSLLSDVLVAGDSLLAAINALPDLKTNNLAFVQDPNTGNLTLVMGDELFVLVPVSVVQAATDAVPGVAINTDGSVLFTTATQRLVQVQPSLEDPEAFQSALGSLGLKQFTARPDGNLTIAATDQRYYMARPDWQTQLTSLLAPIGFDTQSSPLVKSVPVFLLRFAHADGTNRRQQFIYSAAAHQQELQTMLQGIPGITWVHFYNNGTVSAKIGERTYTAVFDYQVDKGPVSKVTQLLTIPDYNGDGSEDIRVVYANGDQQILYMVPFPALFAEIQDIPAVQQAKYTVTEDVNGNLVFMQLLKRLLMRITNVMPVNQTTPPTMTLYPDGSGLFITGSGQQVRTQPLVQDLAALQIALRALGLPGVLEEGNGNLTIPLSTTLSYSARPALESNFTWLTMPLGVQTIPTSLPGVIKVVFIFRDETGNKRQQYIYPAAKEPQTLYTFFTNAPGVSSVVLNNDGSIAVTGSGNINFRGIFDYAVVAGEVPTGGIQFTEVPDVNGDGIKDYTVTYGNGKRQVIYRLP